MTQVKTNFEGKTFFTAIYVYKASCDLGIHLEEQVICNVDQKANPHLVASYLRHHYPGARYIFFCMPLYCNQIC